MKKFLLSFFIVSLIVSSVEAQFANRRKKPKKGGGNHSNENNFRGFSGVNSVLYSSAANEDFTSATVATPTGWGSAETFGFVTAGGTPRQTYADKARQPADMFAQAGFGIGNAKKFVSAVGILNINDVSAFQNISASFIVSRQISKTSSISVGGLHLFANANLTDAGPSYYAAYSKMLSPKFSYTVGVGTGRFVDNTEFDEAAGITSRGTAVFGSVSYQATRNVNVNAEWTGRNLAFSSAVKVKRGWPVLLMGVDNVTRVSGDHATFVVGIGQGLVFNRHK